MADSPEEEYQLEQDAIEYHADMQFQREHASRHALAVAQNVTANGRCFSALVCIADIYAGHHVLAIAAAIPVGLAAIGDQLPAGHGRTAFTIVTYGLAAVVAVASLIAGA